MNLKICNKNLINKFKQKQILLKTMFQMQIDYKLHFIICQRIFIKIYWLKKIIKKTLKISWKIQMFKINKFEKNFKKIGFNF